jgi:hypothetical protein
MLQLTVQQILAHVDTVGYRYRQLARGSDYHHAADPRDTVIVNQAELEAAMAPVPNSPMNSEPSPQSWTAPSMRTATTGRGSRSTRSGSCPTCSWRYTRSVRPIPQSARHHKPLGV